MIKVGIIGAGAMGQMHSDIYRDMQSVEVVAVADANYDKAKNISSKLDCASYCDAKELINTIGIDAIDICLPTPFHKEYAVLAASKGINVLCEKPIALNLQDAEEMVDSAKRSGIVLMIGHCLRFSPAYTLLKDYIDSNRFGKLISLSLHRHSAIPTWAENNWLADKAQSGGVAVDLHVHDTDAILYLLGKPEYVMSSCSFNNISTLYGYPDMTVYAEGSWRLQQKYPFSMGYDAMFEKATVVFKDDSILVYELDSEPKKIDQFENINKYHSSIANLTNHGNYMYHEEIKYFINCVRNKLKPERLMPEQSLEALKILLTEIESASRKLNIRYI